MIFRSATVNIVATLLALAPGAHSFRTGRAPSPQADPAAATPSRLPMPFKWPLVGTLPDFFARGGVDGLSEVHESMYRDYGPAYGLSLAGDDEAVFADPRVLDQALRREGKFPVGAAEGVTTFADYYAENGMDFARQGVSRGPRWREYRQATNPDLYVQWATYLPAIADACRKISAVAGREVTETRRLSMADFLSRAAFDMFSAILYGESPETTDTRKAAPEDVAFVSATKRAFDITGALTTNPLEKMFESDLYKEFVCNMDQTVALARVRGGERIRTAMDNKALREANEREAKAAAIDSGAGSGCPIAAIQSTLSETGKKLVPTDVVNPSYIERLVNRGTLSPDQISEVQAPLLMAGVDTTAYVMGWFYLNIASNPDVQTKLAQELKEKLDGADVTTVEQMESLTYLRQCFRESHRLTPTAPMSIKTLEEDLRVVTGDKAYVVPAGRRISLNLRGYPMDPRYVEDPAAFSPERFSPEAVASRRGTPSALALDHPAMQDPFGRGKRKCLGANVAVAEMTVLAARLLQDWEIRLADPREAVQSPARTWKPKLKLMLVADPYPAMTMVPRNKKR